ncbi:hypothetical protein [Thermococcus sp. JdF3]|uniref:hypothetical protein n=1 Tax=Thermococcus sp. JdF3 TaxID=1638258 RepID=UPI001F107932|nr:hypothetical protein [Thermococcus sp. JdF3]
MTAKVKVLRRLLSTLSLGYILFFYIRDDVLGQVEAGGYSIRVRDDVARLLSSGLLRAPHGELL